MRQGRSRLGNNTIPWWVFLGIALLAVIAVAAVFYRRAEDIRESEAAESLAIEESVVASLAEAEAAAEAELPEFGICDDPDIVEAVTAYFDYRLRADVSSLLRLFGRRDTSGDESLQSELSAQASWIQGFNDITIYTAPGPGDDEYVGLVTYVIDFRRTDEQAPGIMYCFISRDDAGDIILTENPLKDKLDFADTLLSGDFASGLIDETNEALQAALEANSTLALIYTSFLNGDIYEESGFDPDREQEVGVFSDPADSVLVDEEALKRAEEEVREAESIEASLADQDVYSGGGE